MGQSSTGVRTANDFTTSGLIADNQAALRQAANLLERLDDEIFGKTNHALALSSVGGHLRHCLDFYQNFLAGLATGRVNYDHRERDERIEKSRLFAMAKINSVIEGLSRLRAAELDALMEVNAETPAAPEWSRSSVRRELQFLLSHTVHHYSLVAVALRAQGVEPGADFGVAPSTLRYRRKIA